jgi:hypothetical protein
MLPITTSRQRLRIELGIYCPISKAQHQQRGANEYHGIGGPLHVSDRRIDPNWPIVW